LHSKFSSPANAEVVIMALFVKGKPVTDVTSGNAEPEIKSPCMSLCCLDEQDVCIGCHRSVKEITGWRGMTHQQKKETMMQVVKREQASGRMMS